MKSLIAVLTLALALVIAAPARAATYNVTVAKSATSILATVDTINFSLVCGTVVVVNRSATDIWVTVDGSTPTITGDDVHVVPAGGIRSFLFPDPLNARQVKVTASVASAYSLDVY